MGTQQAFGGPAEIQATAQEVQRDGNGAVRVRLTAPPGPPVAGRWRLGFAEPVAVASGERIVIETGWLAIDEASRLQQPFAMTGGGTLTAVFG